MRPCRGFRSQILEGDPHELRGEGDSRLAAHVRECSGCARAAATVLAELERLDAFLASDPSDAVVDRVLARAGPTVPGSRGPALADLHPTGRPRPWPGRWTMVAAAAAVAALLLLPGSPVPPAPEAPAGGTLRLPTVEAMSGQRVAVLETDNPDITVLWFF